ncbi:YhdH/YhfP family quinone oxidoreductase [Xylocopilactobacillus apis]|uniref:Oxidoreductase n=1 Tax=Xylocopilactobacillus apis TaxID=2932183 RepID=A0AAU9CWB5_9LACO|nr:YhdH/YhfP family quinone oxidoreductase [Xylocopilactobacillus apis]BDR56721.1 oxidoreductase [Xylocopilactobacillus apis]
MEKFNALVVRKQGSKVTCQMEQVNECMLGEGELLIKVMYSSLNYKDMLSFQTSGGIIRNYPMIPGIDLSGIVQKSTDFRFKIGQEVLVTGKGLGVSHPGGFSEYAKVPADWVVPLPDNLSLRESMVYGTAGLTAGLSINALEENGLNRDLNQSILVTGATGGVGSIGLKILSKIGFQNLTAIVRKKNQIDIAKKLGANRVILLKEFNFSKHLLAEQKFDYLLDTVGGDLLSRLLPYMSYQGRVSLCGNVGGVELNTTVFPFILRGVNLLGIDSVQISVEKRNLIWNKLANDWKVTNSLLINEVEINNLSDSIESLKEGHHLGRTIVKIS